MKAMLDAHEAPPAAAGPRALSPLPIRQGFAWSLIGVGGFAGAQWAIIVLIAKLGTVEMLGAYSFALALSAPVLLFFHLNLRLAQAVDRHRAFLFHEYLAVRGLGSLLALALLFVILLAAGQTAAVGLVVGVVAIGKSIDGFSDVAHGLMQQQERTDQQALSLLLRGALQVSLVASALYLRAPVAVVSGMVALGSLVSLVSFDVPRSRAVLHHLGEADAWSRLTLRDAWASNGRRLVERALPLGIMAVLGSLYQNIPRFFLEHTLGLRAVGFYSAVFYLTFVGYTAVAAIGNATSPLLARVFQANRARFRRVAFQLAAIGAGIGLVGVAVAVLAGGRLLGVLYRPEYSAYQGLLVWVMVSSTLWYAAALLSFAAIAADQIKVQAILHAVAALATLVVSPFAIRAFGLVGGAVALTVGIIPLLLGESVVVWRASRPGPPADSDPSSVPSVLAVL